MQRAFLVATLLAACGGGGSGPTDAHPDAYPTAAHTPYPQVPNLGGPILAHPQLVTITFNNDPRAQTLESFAQWIVTSHWLATVGTEFGVGSGAVAGVAHRPEVPPATVTNADIEAYIAAGVMDGSIPSPAAPETLADALYIIYYPSTTAITTTFVDGIMKSSCYDFGGYHGEVHQGALNFAYAAIPDCGFPDPGLTNDQTTEEIVSHEVLEAATDAMPISAPAWQLRPDPTDVWYTTFQFEVELGDMCEEPARFIMESGFTAQRTWSNAAAAAGGEPCLPIDPRLPAFGTTATPTGVQHTAVGTVVDLTLAGWSTGPVADWQLMPVISTNTGSIPTRTKISFDQMTLNNGETTTAHVTIPPAAASGSESTIFLISQHNATDATMWPLDVDVD